MSLCIVINNSLLQVPPHCIPIHANVTTYDWGPLVEACQFDVIMMDPPWQLATANPTRGVALGYSQLTDADIQALPIGRLQSNGFLFIWVINTKYHFTLDLLDRWGYRLVDEVVWVKLTVNRRLAKSHGFYLQHAKEVCLVAKKGADPPGLQHRVGSDVILRNNLRNHWVTIGNEVTGKGPPAEDAVAVQDCGMVPGAVYGRAN
ncbi:hypothetical protein QBZ16_001571 [Prototheca wickerhamii]|uniref:mRNA m(6)A methyltransferase n=1 Tax=Prototheca wickerhamii TaxID=3111 RepID=A0AAD9IFS0_PROWI|nr:hypothetical protein QBZ16_001571 [Prototheca wickerhamii]